MTTRTLSHEEARRVYDLIGSRQDSQAFYEDRATDLLVAHGDFSNAQRVFEFGCGTGRFAERLLRHHLPAGATYTGIDLSPEMTRLARQRLAPFGARVEVHLTDGSPSLGAATASHDRFVSNFVLDLLSEADIRAVLHEAHRVLAPNGLLCLASLAAGSGLLSRSVAALWRRVHGVAPKLVGGCRPIRLLQYLDSNAWSLRFHQQVTPFGLPSEVVVAQPAGPPLSGR